MSIFWLIALIVLLVLEAATIQLVSIWFAAGAALALLTSLLTDNILIQIIVFIVSSGLVLAFLRPTVQKLLKPKDTKTNVHALVGQSALLTEEVDNDRDTGALKLAGTTWSVRSSNGEKIPKDEKVIVEKVEGVKLYVRKDG